MYRNHLCGFFCQFATEMTFALLRNGCSLHLIPVILQVNSAFLFGWMLRAGPVMVWVSMSYFLGKKGMAFCIACTLFKINVCSFLLLPNTWVFFVISLKTLPVFPPPFCVQDVSLSRKGSVFISLLRRLKYTG